MNQILKPLITSTDKNAPLWIICPFAGGSYSAFRSWQNIYLTNQDPSMEVVLATYPGRDHRIKETPLQQITNLADELATALLAMPEIQNRKLILCGHSMGAQVAFETCLRLESASLYPEALILSACQAPHFVPRRLLSHLQGKDFVSELIEIGGCSPMLLEHPRLLDMFLPMLQADFIATESYLLKLDKQYRQLINTRCILVCAKDDDEAWPEEVCAWRQWLAGEQQFLAPLITLEGKHFYITETPRLFIEQVNQQLETICQNNTARVA